MLFKAQTRMAWRDLHRCPTQGEARAWDGQSEQVIMPSAGPTTKIHLACDG